MNSHEIIQIVLFFGLGIALTPIVGQYMAQVFQGEKRRTAEEIVLSATHAERLKDEAPSQTSPPR